MNRSKAALLGASSICVCASVALFAFVGLGRAGEASLLPYYRSAMMTPEWLSRREAASGEMHRIAPFTVVDQNGRVMTRRAFAGKVTVAQFFFTGCGDICPTTTTNLQRLLASLPNRADLQIMSYSVMPGADSVAALRSFARARRIVDPRWHLVTGAPSVISDLASHSYFVRIGKDSTYGVASIAHTETVTLVDGRGRMRGVYAGTLPLELDRLRGDLLELLREQRAPEY